MPAPVIIAPEEARVLLTFHSGANTDIHDPRWERGFLGMLRPYRGLREQAFHEVMACIRALSTELAAATLDRVLVSSLWTICQLGRAWGVDAGGMLRSNNLISQEDVVRLDSWLDTISYATMCLLDGTGEHVAFEFYDQM